MTQHIRDLAKLIRAQRTRAGLSAAELARRAGVTTATITRLELQQIPTPRAETLRGIAHALNIPTSDLLASADYLDAGELPSIMPYMRAKYRDLPVLAQEEIADAIRDIATRHGYDPESTGPSPHEDEH